MRKLLLIILGFIILTGIVSAETYRGEGVYPTRHDGTKYRDWNSAFSAGRWEMVWYDGNIVTYNVGYSSNTLKDVYIDGVVYYKEEE